VHIQDTVQKFAAIFNKGIHGVAATKDNRIKQTGGKGKSNRKPIW
jgi:hypothetical protein